MLAAQLTGSLHMHDKSSFIGIAATGIIAFHALALLLQMSILSLHSETGLTRQVLVWLMIGAVHVAMLAIVSYAIYLRKIDRSQLYIQSPKNITLTRICVLIALMYPLLIYFRAEELASSGISPSAFLEHDDRLSPHDNYIVLVVIMVVLIIPLGEEILYRGLLLGALTSRFGLVISCLLSAGVFAVFHFSAGGAAQAFTMGLLNAAVTIATKSLLPAIFLHAGTNASVLIVDLVEA